MAGKKSRKRQTGRGSTKKVSKQIDNDGSVSVEEKKPKLDDGLEEQAEQCDKRVQQPNLETRTFVDTKNNLAEDLQSEENKYVPPFTRKSKRTLQRDRLSSVSPDVRSARPKRPWKGKRISKETQQSLADQQSPADQLDSPEMREEEKEEYIDVETFREVMICTQEKKDLDVISTGKNTADELAVTRDEIHLSSMVSTAQEQTSNIVMLVIENLFETMYKQTNQCNNSEVTTEEPKASVEETDTHSVVNSDIEGTDSSKETDIISEEVVKPNIETAAKPVILTKAALKTIIVTGKTASKKVKKGKAVARSESQTTTLQQQQDQSTSTKQQHTSVEGHVHSTQETATLEGALKKYGTGINNHADETVENDNKGDLPYSPCQNEIKTTANQQGNSETDHDSEPDSQNYTVTSKGICDTDSDAELKNLETEGSPITNLKEKDAVSRNNAITSINEEVHDLSTTPIPMDKDVSSTDICCGNHVLLSEKEHHQQRACDVSLKSDECTTVTRMVHKPNMDTPVTENEMPSTVESGNCGESSSNMCQIDSDQDLDQMVPNNCETTPVMLQENPDVESFTRKPKRKEIDLEVSARVWSKQQSSPHIKEREHECHDLDVQMDEILTAETGTAREINESCLESSQLLKTSTTQASEFWVDQEPTTHEQITMDKTVTCAVSPLQSESFCKDMAETVEVHQTVEDEITKNQSSKVEAGCSLFGFDGDMEFESLMDCTDSQLVHVDHSSNENLHPESYKHDARQLLNSSNVSGNSTSNGHHSSVEVPSDKGMIKGLISELSGLNKFIMGAWKDLENQKKRRQVRLKLGKMKKLK